MSIDSTYRDFLEGMNHPLKNVDSQSPVQKIMNPGDLQDDFTRQILHPDYGFIGAKRLPDGGYAGMLRLMRTVAIAMDIRDSGCFQRRYCFEDLNSCLAAYEGLKTRDDVPEGWIARRPELPEDAERKHKELMAKFAKFEKNNPSDTPEP